MLSPKSTETVRATLPAVGAAIGDVAPLFYRKLFAAHPELLRDLFNRGNQATGEQQQALAGSIVAFATALLRHPDSTPEALLSRIAHKHASLGIAPAQYEIVYTHLFAALAEVLGDAVTDEVAEAWTEVYWLMADSLIAMESRLYAESGTTPETVLRDHIVVARRSETETVAVFTVRPSDGSAPAAARPGQYVSVQVQLPDGARQIRQYSLVSAPGADGSLHFAVKCLADEPAGEVSTHLHDHVATGDVLRVSAPFGDSVLEEGDAPLLLASAGIGCTPLTGMLSRLASTGTTRPVTVVHADRSPATHAFRAELERYVDELPHADAHIWYEVPGPDWPAERTGYADLAALDVPQGTTAYLCGPLPFMRRARGQLLAAGVRAADIHHEVFGPDLWRGEE
ncbi:globin domain-containing protein [Streptomyces sulphureus]|uniref:globin domain-containing protein n=1 Tax=Streptomyces sulphureus TaxID=47758 RepID=UPI000365B5D4|nr:globin domain-containing protein [Streptomyces sulphureus]